MLFRFALAALAGGVVLETMASPVHRDDAAATAPVAKKRAVPATHALHERHMPHWTKRWTRKDRLPASTLLPMRIGLKQSNLDVGYDRLMDISDPSSPSYGKHMTPEEVIGFFAPHQSRVDTVISWLVDSGISRDRIGHSTNKQWIQFDATAEEAGNLLYTDFYQWEHTSGSHDVSCEEYHIPDHVQEHIDYVTPGVRMRPSTKKNAKRAPGREANHPRPDITKLPGLPQINSTTCSNYVVAECARVQYGIPNATTAAPGNELGIFEALDDHYSRNDLDVFFSSLYPHIPNGTYPEGRLIDGAIGAAEDAPAGTTIEPGTESALDFDSAWPLIYPQKTVLFQEDDEYYESHGAASNGFWNTFFDAMDGSYCTYSAYGETGDCTAKECQDPQYPDLNPGGYTGQLQCGVYQPTNVISISYSYEEWGLPDYYTKRQCDEFMKLSLQGVTIVMSSGDSGVGGDGECRGEDGDIFSPYGGTTCPYVLGVGSTEWNRKDPSAPPQEWEVLEEVATKRFGSGSGFSNIFGIPSYQRAAVKGYFDQVKLPFSGYHHFVTDGNFSNVTGGVYHHGGRAYPDIAAVGDRQLVYADGSWWSVGGTSLSAPVVGAVLTLINEVRIAAGKSTVGFIHPIIYAHPEAFTDITVGNSPGCGSDGFVAAPGWDPVTGLGSPNFPVLMKLLTEM